MSVTRLDNIIKTGFWLALQYEEQMRRRVESQDVHWLALIPDLSHREAWKYEAALGKGSSAGGEMPFSTKFTEMPRLFAAVQTMNDRDPVSIRVTDLKSSHGVVILQEEQSLDPETSHQVELIGWVAATGDLLFSHSINRVQIRDSTFIAWNSCRCHSTDRVPIQNRDGERNVPDRQFRGRQTRMVLRFRLTVTETRTRSLKQYLEETHRFVAESEGSSLAREFKVGSHPQPFYLSFSVTFILLTNCSRSCCASLWLGSISKICFNASNVSGQRFKSFWHRA